MSPGRLLVRAPSWLGDFCMAEPVFAAVEAQGTAWTLAGPGRFLDLVSGRFDHAQLLPTDDNEGGFENWRDHDVALLLNGSFRSLWSAFRARIPERVCWSTSARGWLATTAPSPAREAGRAALGCSVKGRAPRRMPRPFGAACVELAGLAGITVTRRIPRLQASASDREALRARLEKEGVEADQPFVLINLGGRPGTAKTPPLERWREWLERRDGFLALPRVLLCGPGEEERVQALAAHGTPLLEPCLTLGEWLALAELAVHGLTPDSGPRHLAAAAGLPQTVLFGPTDPRHTGENTRDTALLRGSADCAPCHLERCPLAGERERSCHAHSADHSVESLARRDFSSRSQTTLLR